MPGGLHSVLIFISQFVHQVVTPPYLLDTASKGAIEQMTRVMSNGLLSKGICANAWAPGSTETDILYRGKTKRILISMAGISLIGRTEKPEEIAEATVWLSGEQNPRVSQQVLRTNGGSA